MSWITTFTLCFATFAFAKENRFNCKPRPGCSFAQCDPVPPGYLELEGFDADLYRKLNEYHITCEPVTQGPQSIKQDFGKDEITDYIDKKIGILRSELFSAVEAKFQQSPSPETTPAFVDVIPHKDESIGPTLSSDTSCTLKKDGICFWMIFPEAPISFSKARYECEKDGGRMGILYSATGMEKVMEHIRKNMINNPTYLWLGIKMNPKTNELQIPGRSFIQGYLPWFPNYPQGSHPHVALAVNLDPVSIYQGIFNSSPADNLHGVFCEKRIS